MKKLFTVDDFMVAFISALGYGFGETIARLSGWSMFMCTVASTVLGIVLEEFISNIVFSKAIQKSNERRIVTFAAIFLFFLGAQWVSIRWMGLSLIEYVHEEFIYVIINPVFGFIVNILIRFYRLWKIRRLYGDGSEGYVFNLKKGDIEELNKQNHPILGSYDTDLAVKTRTGIYVGEKYKDTISYLGIPYAQPPVGSMRWKAPNPLPPSEDVYEAKHLGASAIQVELKGAILKNHRQSEDCLYLNICVGIEKDEKPKKKNKKPVLVLFHNGDFTYGGSADPLLYGANFVENNPDIVFVSFNYRLGIFGFIDFSEVDGGKAYTDAPNLGLLDQIAALQWIKENIAAFSGDPEKITALGFEAGATSISLLAASGAAKGLFQKAFVFNGNPMTVHDTPVGSRNLAKDLLKETEARTMEELLQLDTEALKDVAQVLWKDMCAPTADGKMIPEDVYHAYQEGAASEIEFIIGIPSRESRIIRDFLSEAEYEMLTETVMTDISGSLDKSLATAVQEYVRAQTAISSELDARSKVIDQWIALCIYRCAWKLSEGGNKVHVMYWDEKPLIENLGSGTVDVAAMLLGNGEALQLYGNVLDKDLSVTLQEFLHKFVKGDALQLYRNEIKGIGDIDWEPFHKALIVSDKKFSCDTIENRLKEIEGLFVFAVS